MEDIDVSFSLCISPKKRKKEETICSVMKSVKYIRHFTWRIH
jgi:hypothetical protein